jgi:RNA polymerase sigma-70 factor (ECF subfamily)
MHETLKRVRAGDPLAFREIVREYGPMVRVQLFSHLSDHHAVEDLSQEIFVAAYWALESYDSTRDFRTWLSAIARNKLMSHLRKQYSDKNSANVLTVDIHELMLPDLGRCNAATEAVTAQLLNCIDKHPEKDRLLVEARYFEEESVTAIAERLRTTVSAISSNLYRIRAQLRQCIEENLAL